VSGRLRVFLIGSTRADLDRLRARAATDPTLDIAGAAVKTEIDRGIVRIPITVDAVLTTPAAAGASGSPDEDSTSATRDLIEDLTPREHDVLALLADGLGNREIADRLGVSEHTVKFHLASIFGKLGASTRTEAVRKALELGLFAI
jgi:DNA-binding NarL/FixJ family response regulator